MLCEVAVRMPLFLTWHAISRWRLADLCYNVKPPETVVYPYLDGIFTEMNPCVVLSVLDCFWDGGLVHDRPQPYHLKVPGTTYDRDVSWITLDPHELLDVMDKALPRLDAVIKEVLLVHVFILSL